MKNFRVEPEASRARLFWDKPTVPDQNHNFDEYSQVVVVRYDGNIFDQQTWPRSAPSASGTLIETILWTPRDSWDPTDLINDPFNPIPAGVTIIAVGDLLFPEVCQDLACISITDVSVIGSDTFTYAVFAINALNHYSFPAVALKQSQKLLIIPPEGGLTSVRAGHVSNHDKKDSIHDLPIDINIELNLSIDDDADNYPTSFDFYSLYGWEDANFSPIPSPSEFIQFDYDLTDLDYGAAALTFDEIVEVAGVAIDGQSALIQFCSLKILVMDRSGVYGNPQVVIKDHSSTTFDFNISEADALPLFGPDPDPSDGVFTEEEIFQAGFNGQYIWRSQEVNLDAFLGKRIRVVWELQTSGSGITVSNGVGWLLDNIEVRIDLGGTIGCQTADINGDGVVDASDMAALLVNWGAVPTPSCCVHRRSELRWSG